METITLQPLQHNQEENIGMFFPNIGLLNKAVRTIKKARWATTHKCWYVPMNKVKHTEIVKAFKGIATIEQSALHTYLTQKKNKPVTKKSDQPTTAKKEKTESKIMNGIYPVNAHVIPALRQHLVLKAYSASTLKTYTNEVGVFLRTIKNHDADSFNAKRIKDYLQYCSEKLGLSENTLHSRMNALKYYYEKVLKQNKLFWDIPRPKKAKQLPKVLSKEEIIRLIKAIDNLKHKTMIMIGYACGLRVSEITGLEINDVDEDRRLLLIRKGKGKKDRIVSLSPVMLVMIREYKDSYKPIKYLFEGQTKGTTYSTRSLESIIKTAKQKAGIKKGGSMHMLRHSFATHLIDKGTDVVYIQKLLGHNDIKTTLRYLHVTNKDILNILSPIEDIKDFL